ncbi:TraV family lipoprotein [Sinimarinibacterium sp. NLF-5-8]|uniref:TraV family lipoprotein n=1 Tax=Sinimarinibacterium sp. NLF-5-8 TaxID=2698684 RepID=UPI00137C1CB5|nr:TraV family lipoprotein [Sinimarinibacterium sp. NLF-5-8]QHS09119.1 TraV family lipoprotein [Sinimarinibacterium sp. NLF-5-8]
MSVFSYRFFAQTGLLALTCVAASGCATRAQPQAVSALHSEPGQQHFAGLVYTPPKPYRVGIAPWTDDQNILHSGEFIYFTSKGKWSQPHIPIPGSASAVLPSK